jgi:hypothetical protein
MRKSLCAKVRYCAENICTPSLILALTLVHRSRIVFRHGGKPRLSTEQRSSEFRSRVCGYMSIHDIPHHVHGNILSALVEMQAEMRGGV